MSSNNLDLLQKFDIFGKSVPQFNLAGKKKIRTTAGGLITFVFTTVLISYGIVKLQSLINRKDPNIRQATKFEHYDQSEILDLKQIGMRFAFTVENYLL